MKNIQFYIGVAMMVILFLAIFVAIAMAGGIEAALIVFSAAATGVLWAVIAMRLMSP